MLLLSQKDIEKIFTISDAIEANKIAFAAESAGKSITPLRTNINVDGNDGSFLFMPTYLPEKNIAAMKMISIFPDNVKTDLPTSHANILLMDAATGITKAILDGNSVTRLRTGGASGAAFDILAKKQCMVGALIGTGGQAEAQLDAMIAARDLQEIRIYSRNSDKRAAFTKKMQEKYSGHQVTIINVPDSDAAIDNADLIITATNSAAPVFDAAKVKNGATISCVGSFQYHMQELDPAIFAGKPKLYFDSTSAVLSESGDILKPMDAGIITEKDFTGELGNVISGKTPGRENNDEIIIFKTVGVATQDLISANIIYEKAIELKASTEWA